MKRLGYQILTFLSVIFFLLYFYRSAIPFIEYKFLKEYIIEKLCVNKDKPEMQCNGKCHLKKQIKNEEEKEKENPFISNKQTVLYFFNLMNEFNYSSPSHDIFNIYLCNYKYIFFKELLIPPKASFKYPSNIQQNHIGLC